MKLCAMASLIFESLNGLIAIVWRDQKLCQKPISRAASKLLGYILLIDAKYLSGWLTSRRAISTVSTVNLKLMMHHQHQQGTLSSKSLLLHHPLILHSCIGQMQP